MKEFLVSICSCNNHLCIVTCKRRLYVFDNCLVHLKSTHTSATIHKKTTRKVNIRFLRNLNSHQFKADMKPILRRTDSDFP
jgi:hypothetical protein